MNFRTFSFALKVWDSSTMQFSRGYQTKETKFIHHKTPYGPPPRSDEEEDDSSEDSEDNWTPPTHKKSKK